MSRELNHGDGSAADRFEGFAPGERVTPIPQSFWLELLPRMNDPAELAVTLYALDGLSRVRRFPRRLALTELRNARPLIEALDSLCPERELEQAFNDGLSAAVERGSLLCERIQSNAHSPQVGWSDWIALNDVDGRRAMAFAPSLPAAAASLQPAQPRGGGIVQLWQDAFGTGLTPLLRDELLEAEARYPYDWLRDAFTEAAAQHVRSWRYVQRILERWQEEGRDETTRTAGGGSGSRMDESRYRHLIRE